MPGCASSQVRSRAATPARQSIATTESGSPCWPFVPCGTFGSVRPHDRAGQTQPLRFTPTIRLQNFVGDTGSTDFGHRLRRLRLDGGLTQEALAELSGVSVQAIAALERGARRFPRGDTIAMLAAALGVGAAA